MTRPPQENSGSSSPASDKCFPTKARKGGTTVYAEFSDPLLPQARTASRS